MITREILEKEGRFIDGVYYGYLKNETVPPKELTYVKPGRMIGNLYFVGSKEASSHLIATDEGLILIDTGYVQSAEGVLAGIRELGFDPRDIKVILHSHGHLDHTDATGAILREAPEAKTYLNKNDLKYIRFFTPDYDIEDGTVIRLGGTEITCLHTPGHTEGTVSFFFDVEEDGKVYRAASFGGAGTNQLKKPFMDRCCVPYVMRGKFLDSIERVIDMPVDVFVGNHTGHNDTVGKLPLVGHGANPFVDPTLWKKFLSTLPPKLFEIMKNETFINYAHRGASHYCPENTMLSFYTGMYMRANGIETDVQMTRDGVVVIYHDDNMQRISGVDGKIADYTYEELLKLPVTNNGLSDRIPTFRDFLIHMSAFDITFAIELKVAGIEKEVADIIYELGMEKRVVITSFIFDAIKKMKEVAPRLRVGYLKNGVTDEVIDDLLSIGGDEICPLGTKLTREKVDKWHRIGLNVRAWGISDTAVMTDVYRMGVDGMTVNFPDELTRLTEAEGRY